MIAKNVFQGEENEEYEEKWSEGQSSSRFGALESFPYRYFTANLRLLQIVKCPSTATPWDVRSVGADSFLLQQRDLKTTGENDLKVATQRAPSEAELRAMLFGWRVVKHVKSNAIVFCAGGATVGVGAGQMSRLDSARIASIKAHHAGLSLAGSVVASNDNYFAALNAAVFSDGSFVFIPKGVECPMELSTYFRINQAGTGQFERTLVVADQGSYVSYLEGCTAPSRDENQLHAAVVELIALDDAEIKYSTVQNWFPGDKEGRGGVYNFVTKRGIAHHRAKISWTQVETGSAVTWKYPSCVLKGDDSVGEFYSIAVTNNHQQADTGTKMIHLGRNTRSTIISKGISAGKSQNSYRGLVQIGARAEGARNFSQCDSLLMGNQCGAHTFPYIEAQNKSAQIEHEATTSKIGEDQIFYCNQRGIDTESAIALIVNGFSKEVLNKLPMEFAVEAQKLLEISLEGSVG